MDRVAPGFGTQVREDQRQLCGSGGDGALLAGRERERDGGCVVVALGRRVAQRY